MSDVINLAPLLEAQKALEERIIKEKGLEGQDLLPNTILALQVELGELANEWRGFKHWSNNREPNTKAEIGAYDDSQGGKWVVTGYKNPMLEEYVDCLSFILSIGLQIGDERSIPDCLPRFSIEGNKHENLVAQFIETMFYAVVANNHYPKVMFKFIALGEMLGFTWEQIESAYYFKNKINHDRQASGY